MMRKWQTIFISIFLAFITCIPTTFAGLHYPHVSKDGNAQHLFEKGMLNYFAYLYVQAEYDFRQALLYDPNCGMCYFGLAIAKKQEALELGQPFAMVGYDFIQRAKLLIVDKDPFYQKLINIAAQSFSSNPKASSKHLQVDYINGLKQLLHENQSTAWRAESLALWVDAVAFYANVQNEDMGDIVIGHCGHSLPSSYKTEALSTLRTALTRDEFFWTHPGIIHTYIHMAERDLKDPLGLKAAVLLPTFSSEMIAHYTHMPNHIYWRRGMLQQAIQANLDAIKIDQHYFKSGGVGLNSYYYEYHYLHSHHFLTALGILTQDYQLSLKYAQAVKQLMDVERMASLPDYRDTFLTLEHLVYARFGKWEEALALPIPFGTGPLGMLFIDFTKALASLNLNHLVSFNKLLQQIKSKQFTDPVNKKIQILVLAYLNAVSLQQQHKPLNEIAAVFAKNQVAQIEQDLSIMNPPIWFFPYQRLLTEIQAVQH